MVAARSSAVESVVRVAPNGSTTSFPVGTAGGPVLGLDGITLGPDRNLWFTEFFAGRVGRMTPSGTVTEFALPRGSSANPRGITAGTDGNLWLTEASSTSSAIARMTVEGQVTEFPIDGQQAEPTSIVSGSDGNVWFTETVKSSVGRISPAGVITEFAVGGRMPLGITAGRDGNLWFTAAGLPGGIGRITTSGSVTFFKLPPPAGSTQQVGIAQGPDGRIWFADAGRRQVGAIGLTPVEIGLDRTLLSFPADSGTTTRRAVITNTAEGPLRIRSVALAGPDQADFTVASETCTGHSLSTGQTCRIDVAASVGGSGLRAGVLQLVDNATGSPQAISLLAGQPACTLPVVTVASSPQPTAGRQLNLGTGETTDDPGGQFEFDSTNQLYRTLAGPPLAGGQPGYFDRAAQRWLPVRGALVRPDGGAYAYLAVNSAGNSSVLHVVDVATGRDTPLSQPSGFPQIYDYDSGGIYFALGGYESPGHGLQVVNPATDSISTLMTTGAVESVVAGGAWMLQLRPGDASAPGAYPSSDEVLRRDLSTGTTVSWFYRAGAAVSVLGYAGGSLFVTDSTDQGVSREYWVVSAPGRMSKIALPDPLDQLDRPTADAVGVWFGGVSGLFLWTERTGLIEISQDPVLPAGSCA
jgi:virginiamycin B lyase